MVPFAFILCSSLLLSGVLAAPNTAPVVVKEKKTFDQVTKDIMGKVMNDMFAGKSMPKAVVERTIEELNKMDGEIASALESGLKRVRDLQNGETIETVSSTIVDDLVKKYQGKVKGLDKWYKNFGEENVKGLIARLAKRLEEVIKNFFAQHAVEETTVVA